MGLSVSVFKNISLSDNEEEDGFFAYVISPEWEYKIKNLKKDKRYTGELCDVGVGYGYGYHSRFREHLVKLSGRPDLVFADGRISWDKLNNSCPFYDFVDFADNEGCLDWEISEKILKDFVAFKDKAEIYFKNDSIMGDRYKDWLNIFTEAVKHKGVVVFS